MLSTWLSKKLEAHIPFFVHLQMALAPFDTIFAEGVTRISCFAFVVAIGIKHGRDAVLHFADDECTVFPFDDGISLRRSCVDRFHFTKEKAKSVEEMNAGFKDE